MAGSYGHSGAVILVISVMHDSTEIWTSVLACLINGLPIKASLEGPRDDKNFSASSWRIPDRHSPNS